MKKTLLASLVVLGWLAAASTFAYQWNPWTTNPNPTDPVRHEAMQKALETNNYTTWKELMAGKWVLNKITTEEQFKSFIAMRDAYAEGDTTTYNKLKTELWLWLKDGSGTKKWLGNWLKNGSRRGNK
jgi:hypothetical protein